MWPNCYLTGFATQSSGLLAWQVSQPDKIQNLSRLETQLTLGWLKRF